ncbi:hypothetical protein OSTOST_00450 [Ostertagia ostertagi]
MLSVPCALAALPGGDCIEPCVREMQSSLEQTPMLQSEQLGQLSFSQLAGHSHDRQHTQDAFSQICSFCEDAFLWLDLKAVMAIQLKVQPKEGVVGAHGTEVGAAPSRWCSRYRGPASQAYASSRRHWWPSFGKPLKTSRKVDACLELCEKTSESSSRVRQTYAGIRFICVDHEKECEG